MIRKHLASVSRGTCTCGAPRDTTGRYCRDCRARYMRRWRRLTGRVKAPLIDSLQQFREELRRLEREHRFGLQLALEYDHPIGG